MKVYMRVTNDIYELPVAIADTAGQLAEITGTTKNTILANISHKTGTYRKVIIDDYEDPEER